MLQKKWALGRIRVRCRYLRHKVNKSKYKTNPFYDWLFQIVYICHYVAGQTLIPMPCFPNDVLNQTQHTFMMDRDFIKAKRLVSAALYYCYCITNVPRTLQLPLDSWIIETRNKLPCSKFRSVYICTMNSGCRFLSYFQFVPGLIFQTLIKLTSHLMWWVGQ
jgi:hypothetical protein